MLKNTRRTQRGEASLSREHIVDAAIALLDAGGEGGLTFRALAERLGTGAGAIYWHIKDKDDLLDAACDAIVARTLDGLGKEESPMASVRALAGALFDAIDEHPWVGAELARSPGGMPLVRILEALGRQVQAMGVAGPALWRVTTALLSYVLGAAGQNAANRQRARALGRERGAFLDHVAGVWTALDGAAFPFMHAIAGQLREHDDRADFLAGIDLFLAGIAAAR